MEVYVIEKQILYSGKLSVERSGVVFGASRGDKERIEGQQPRSRDRPHDRVRSFARFKKHY